MALRRRSKKKVKGLTIEFIPYAEISMLSSSERIKRILDIVVKNRIVILQGKLLVKNRIVILQGKLLPQEEARLIEDTMILASHVKSFRGIEIAVIEPNKENASMMAKIRKNIAKIFGVYDAITVIGPATIVREIRKDPRKIELMF